MSWLKTNENGTTYEPKYVEVLDFGFVSLIDFMGSDQAVVDAARRSYGGGTKKTSSTRGLLRYMMRGGHTSPFEMNVLKFHVKAPIFVARQWMRHRTGAFNELSGRYSVLPNEFYLPDTVGPQSKTNKQGRDDTGITPDDQYAVRNIMNESFDQSYAAYKYLLGPITDDDGNYYVDELGNMQYPEPPEFIKEARDRVYQSALETIEATKADVAEWAKNNGKTPEECPTYVDWTQEKIDETVETWYQQAGLSIVSDQYKGVARELARLVLPVSMYTEFYWKIDMHNLFHFLKLRSDPHAQKEIRDYANAIYELVAEQFPLSCEAFVDYARDGMSISRMEKLLMKAVFAGMVDPQNTDDVRKFLKDQGSSRREVDEFLAAML